jgi:hypothetical protein
VKPGAEEDFLKKHKIEAAQHSMVDGEVVSDCRISAGTWYAASARQLLSHNWAVGSG